MNQDEIAIQQLFTSNQLMDLRYNVAKWVNDENALACLMSFVNFYKNQNKIYTLTQFVYSQPCIHTKLD